MNLTDYQQFVISLASNENKDVDYLIARLIELRDTSDVNISALDGGLSGLCAEAGEALEIIKKIKFQGKPLDEDVKFHIKRELGDVCFYLALSCHSLGLEISDVIDENVRKLNKRYSSGGFSVTESEIRQSGDV